MRIYHYLLFLSFVLLSSCHPANSPDVTQLFPVKVNGAHYGYADRTGKIVIDTLYNEAACFADGRALVSATPGNWGFIDASGQVAIPASYTAATSFSEGVAMAVRDTGAPVVIDNSGAVKFSMPGTETVCAFHDGLAAFSVISPKGELWGFIDKEGKVIIQPQFGSAGYFVRALCAVMNDEGKWGFINKDGKVVIGYQFDNVANFDGTRAKVMIDGKWGVADNNGKFILKPEYLNLDIDGDKYLILKDGKWGWIDGNSKTLVAARFDDAFPFHSSKLTAVRIGDKWGYIDRKGNVAIQPQYSFAFSFDGDRAVVGNDGRYGLIDAMGVAVSPLAWGELSPDYFLKVYGGVSRYGWVKTNENEPRHIAYAWLNGFFHFDYDGAAKISTNETRDMLNQFANVATLMPDSARQQMMNIRIGINDVHLDGDKALVTYSTSDNPAKSEAISLMQVNGRWLVQFTKNDLISNNDSTATVSYK